MPKATQLVSSRASFTPRTAELQTNFSLLDGVRIQEEKRGIFLVVSKLVCL